MGYVRALACALVLALTGFELAQASSSPRPEVGDREPGAESTTTRGCRDGRDFAAPGIRAVPDAAKQRTEDAACTKGHGGKSWCFS